MINTKTDLKNTLSYEKERYGNIPRCWFLLSLFGISEKAIIWRFQRYLRKWEYHLNSNHLLRKTYYKIKTCSFGRKFNISIPPNVFKKGLKIMHLGSILCNANARIGEDCVLHINTAIVSTNGINEGPILGDRCMLGVGSIIVGNIVLGNEVVVGANAVVTKSFKEDHITIAGVPAKMISRNAIL